MKHGVGWTDTVFLFREDCAAMLIGLMRRLSVLVLVLAALAITVRAIAGLVVAVHTDPVSDTLSPEIRERLADGGAQVSLDETMLTFWWVQALPLAPGSQGAAEWSQTDEGCLVGAVEISTQFRDVRGRVIPPGVYTLRRAIQPADGDHIGVSPYQEFLLLSPAAVDLAPEPTGHDGTIDLSKQAVGISHPAVLSMNPPVSTAEPLSVRLTSDGHQAVALEVPVTREGQPAGTLRFGLILVGLIEA